MSEDADVTVTVTDNPEQSRYEAIDDAGMVAGIAVYERREGLLIFTHTEVDDAAEGKGVGSTLARGALDDARTTGLQVRSACEFFDTYFENHPEYQDLLSH